MRFLLAVAAIYSVWILVKGGLADFWYYWILVGISLFLLQVLFDLGHAASNALQRNKYEFHQHNVYLEERHPDPTIPDWPVIEGRSTRRA